MYNSVSTLVCIIMGTSVGIFAYKEALKAEALWEILQLRIETSWSCVHELISGRLRESLLLRSKIGELGWASYPRSRS